MALKFTTGASVDGCLPAGTYKLQVIKAEEGQSRAGNDQVVVTFAILGDDGRRRGHAIDYLTATDSTVWKIEQFLAACDKHPGPDEPCSLEASACIGWECEAEVVVDSFQGRKSNKIGNYIIPEY